MSYPILFGNMAAQGSVEPVAGVGPAIYWLDFSDTSLMTTSSNEVLSTRDKVGTHSFSVPSNLSSRRPVINDGGLFFDATTHDALENLTYTKTSNDMSVFFVAKQTRRSSGPDNYGRFVSYSKNGNNDYANTFAVMICDNVPTEPINGFQVYRNSQTVTGLQTLVLNNRYVGGFTFSGGNVTQYRNHAKATGTTSTTAVDINRTLIATDPAASDSSVTGNMYEIIAYDRALSESESRLVVNYLENKWTPATQNVVGYTSMGMTAYGLNYKNANPAPIDPLYYKVLGFDDANQFAFHTGHQAGWWPTYYAVEVTKNPNGKVLNEMDWVLHGNAAGNTDFFGSNAAIDGTNFTNESNWTYLGRANFGGQSSGGAAGTSLKRSFNSGGGAYKWYMIKVVDTGNSLVTYPGTSSNKNGWAMYGLRFNKV
jgi:hypothetical protein